MKSFIGVHKVINMLHNDDDLFQLLNTTVMLACYETYLKSSNNRQS